MNFLCLIVIISSSHYASGNLDNTLHYYETLTDNDIQVHSIHKRSIGQSSPIKDVTVNAFSRQFRLILRKHRDFISADFKVTAVDGHGKEKPVFINQDDFYSGYLHGQKDSTVEAYWEAGVFSANIRTPQDEYTIEPIWRHEVPKDSNHTMVAYRASDIKPDQHGKYVSSYCESIRAEGGEVIPNDKVTYNHISVGDLPHVFTSNYSSHTRYKRATPLLNTCPLMLVADYTFYEHIGKNSYELTAKYLMHQIQKVNDIYSTTKFGNFEGMHLEVKSIKIHEVAQASTDPHYNVRQEKWDTQKLLEAFSKHYQEYQRYCLVHLFTHRAFDKGVLGLAYIASPRLGAVGGICTPLYRKSGAILSLNTGWSSSRNSFGSTLISQQAYLVNGHEIGHNFGSEHDPETARCAPSAENNGKFMMYPYAVAGYDSNNKKFSPCSREYVSSVLATKSHLCFKEKKSYFCGNGVVEDQSPEECDAGYKGTLDQDPCCNKDCLLRPGAQCSSYNQGCCDTKCRFAVKDVVCFQSASTDTLTCQGDAQCNGVNAECPARQTRNDGEECGEFGKCKAGVCLPYCKTIGKEPCACDDEPNACKWCCRPEGGGKCVPEPKDNDKLEDGRPCVSGYCENGVCQRTDKNLIVRIWDIIEKITVDKLVEFMKANIVGTVIVFSLIIWIPGSITITCLDKKREKKDRQRKEWLASRNSTFIRPEDRNVFRLRSVPASRRRGLGASVVRGGGDADNRDGFYNAALIDEKPMTTV